MYQLENISRVFRGENVETMALNNVSMTIRKGEFLSIMGPSGCGKSTLLNIIGMLDGPTSGKLSFLGKDISSFGESQLSVLRKENIGFIFQSFNLVDSLSVRENIELALLYRSMSKAERQKRVDDVMDDVGVAHRAGHKPGQLSGGQQQRVAVARAVVGGQSLILADEPTGNLDSQHGDEVMQMLANLNASGTTVVMVTHSKAHADYAHRTVHLFDGKIVASDERTQLGAA